MASFFWHLKNNPLSAHNWNRKLEKDDVESVFSSKSGPMEKYGLKLQRLRNAELA